MDPTLPEESNPRSLVLPLLAVLFGVSLGGGYLYLRSTYPTLFTDTAQKISEIMPAIGNRQAATTSQPTPTPLPTRSPYPLIPDDKTAGTFKVSQGTHDGPTFTDIRIDPLDAKVDQVMSITVDLNSPTNIMAVSGTLYTDMGKVPLSFQKISRNNVTEKWKTSFTLTQPVLYTYKLSLVANDGTSTSSIDMAPRN